MNDEHRVSRVSRSRQEARRAYDRMSCWHHALAASSEWTYVHARLEGLQLRAGQGVLEIGCGTGRAQVAPAEAVGDSGRIYGVGLSEGMFRLAKQRLERKSLTHRVDLCCGDATHLAFDHGTYDAVFVSFTLQLFDMSEMPRVLGECRRVLKPAGRIGVVGMSRTEGSRLMLRLHEWAHSAFPNAIDCRPIFIEKALTDAGLQVVDVVHRSMYGLPVEMIVAAKAGPAVADGWSTLPLGWFSPSRFSRPAGSTRMRRALQACSCAGLPPARRGWLQHGRNVASSGG